MATAEGDTAKFMKNSAVLSDGDASQPAVLVLGGSTFMGRALVERLVARPCRVCVVNRGRRYWGTDDPSGGRAARILADRRNAKEFGKRIDAATQQLPSAKWDLVADFSAYNGADIRAATDGLCGRFRVYAYISSDSIYEVSALAASGWLPPPCPPARQQGEAPQVDESFASRPADEKSRKRLRKADEYGDGKLEAEEALCDSVQGGPEGCWSISLRLPDVIGPFDDTLRLWAFWHWLQAGAAGGPPPQVKDFGDPAKLSRPPTEGGEDAPPLDPALAVVFSQDVARFIVSLLDREGCAQPPGAPRCDAVNLGCTRQEAMPTFLRLLGAASGLGDAVSLAPVEKPKSYLPSVDRPWPLCCRRASDVYGFTPTALEDVLKACADWFASACKDFPGEARRAAGKLPREASQAAIKRARLENAPKSSSSSESSSGDESDS